MYSFLDGRKANKPPRENDHQIAIVREQRGPEFTEQLRLALDGRQHRFDRAAVTVRVGIGEVW